MSNPTSVEEDPVIQAVKAWQQGNGLPLMDLPNEQRIQALNMVGYTTRAHRILFGVEE